MAEPLSRVLPVPRPHDGPGQPPAGPQDRFASLRPGQSVFARVVEQNGTETLVRIEGQTLALHLPRAAERGETLKLVFLGHTPQPVFVLDTAESATNTAPAISQTARMLSEIMQRIPGAPPALAPEHPLLTDPTALPGEIALALRNALTRSGLFYESHLAAWVAGRDSLDGLMREPQNQFATRPPDAEGGTKSTHPLHTLLTQQLQVLESPQLVWRGEAWPGLPMQWWLRRDDDLPPPAPNAAATAWESRLKLDLPRLGEVEVHIRIDARQAFHLRIVPAEADSLALLNDDRPHLTDRLHAAGFTLHALEIARDVPA